MIDNFEKIILEYIVEECQSYKVVEIEDFEEYISQKIGKRKLNINNILKKLNDKNLIIIKYNDNKKYCLSATQTANQIIENQNQEKYKNKKIRLEIIILLVFVLIFAFLGSFLGTLIYNIIF